MTGKRRSLERTPARQFGSRLGVLFTALLALFLNAFVVQTHVHWIGAIGAPAYERVANDDHAHVSAAHEQPGCIICQTLAATGGNALASTTPALIGVAVTDNVVVAPLPTAPRS